MPEGGQNSARHSHCKLRAEDSCREHVRACCQGPGLGLTRGVTGISTIDVEGLLERDFWLFLPDSRKNTTCLKDF